MYLAEVRESLTMHVDDFSIVDSTDVSIFDSIRAYTAYVKLC